MPSYSTRFDKLILEASEAIVSILQGEAVPGGVMYDEDAGKPYVRPKDIFWGVPDKRKRDKFVNQRAIFVLPGRATLRPHTVASYRASLRMHCIAYSHSQIIDRAYYDTIQAAGLIVETFNQKRNESLEGKCRLIYNPDGGDTFTLDPDYSEKKIERQSQYVHMVEVQFVVDAHQDVKG